jgi:hypothetical protein
MRYLSRYPSVVLLIGVLLLLLTVSAPGTVSAQVATGTIEGSAHRLDDNEPLVHSLIRLTAHPAGDTLRTVLTDAQGRFRFNGIPAGSYQLQLELIGHHPVVSPPLQLVAGGTLVHQLRSRFEPIRLTGITVRRGSECLSGSELHQDEELSVLWNEAYKGVEARRAFEMQYQFVQVTTQKIVARYRLLRDGREVRVDTFINQPDSVLVREQRRHARRRAQGYGRPGELLLHLPEDKELLADEFLDEYCLHTNVEQADGALGLRFRPLEARADRIDIRGTIWLDAASFVTRRLDLEWIEVDRVIARGTMVYDDISVGGQGMRMPASGHVSGRPSGRMGLIVTGATADFNFAYSAFQPREAR